MKAVTVAGGSSDDPEIEAGTAVLKAEPEQVSAEPMTEAGPAAAGADDGPNAEAQPGGETEQEADAGPKAETERGAAAHPESGTDARPEAGADPEAESGPRDETVSAAGTDARPAAGSEPKADAEGKAEAEDRGQAEPETEAETGPKAEQEGSARPEVEVEVGAKPKDPRGAAVPEAKGDTDARPKAGSEPKADTRAEADDRSQAETGSEAVSKAEAETGPKAEQEGSARPKAEVEAKPKDPRRAVVPEAAGASGPKAEQRGASRSEADTDARPKAGSKPKAGTRAEADDRSQAETGSEAVSKAEAETGPKAEQEGSARPEAEVEVEAKPKDPRGAAVPEAKGDTDARPKAGSEPKAEAKGPGPAERGSEAVPDGEAPADETQVIVRPVPGGGPREAPSWVRDVEPEAERTSQFVALKDPDALPAPASAPASAPAAAPAPAPSAPLPPLGLLAELTNTPPPTETPRRTALRRVRIWTPILLLLAGAGVGAQLLRPLPAPQLVASATDRTVDGQFTIPWPAKGQGAVRVPGSGDLGTFGEQKPVPTASVAKVMTAYVILKGHPLRKTDPGPDITVDAKTVADGNSEHESRIVGLTAGSKFSQQDMLKMLMIPSGNNVARLLARWDTGTDSEAAFVEKMNAAAKELGMEHTTYTDPSGLDAGTVSTATDQLKLAEAVMKDEAFRAIVALPSATIKGLPQRIENNNSLLTVQGLSVRGIKTGSSTPAGGALMWAAYKSIGDETPLILGTLMEQRVDGPDPDAMNSLSLVKANSQKIIEAVRTALASVPVVRKGDLVGYVNDGLGGRTPLVATKDVNIIGVPGQQVKVSLTVGAGPLPHTAKDGSEVAVLTVGSGEGTRSVPVAVKGALAEPSFGTRLTRGR
ncbi:serine hydrolase [Streptomyces sp. NPDC048257]|uniref:D-alanyl-D-alanine carboxypeptidase family protein n=1 Tax=Streptomyces sp. NPDC048257 TaxID=3365526 RepID=UPI0037237332